jgi:hypothetical protein
MAWTINSSSVMPTNPAIFMLVSSARGALGDETATFGYPRERSF